jgi:hypothetical protein
MSDLAQILVMGHMFVLLGFDTNVLVSFIV